MAADGMPEYEGVEPEGTDMAPPLASISAAAGFLNKWRRCSFRIRTMPSLVKGFANTPFIPSAKLVPHYLEGVREYSPQ